MTLTIQILSAKTLTEKVKTAFAGLAFSPVAA